MLERTRLLIRASDGGLPVVIERLLEDMAAEIDGLRRDRRPAPPIARPHIESFPTDLSDEEIELIDRAHQETGIPYGFMQELLDRDQERKAEVFDREEAARYSRESRA